MRWIEGPALCESGRAFAAAGKEDRSLEKFDAAIEFYRRVGAGQAWIDRAEADRVRMGSKKSDAAKLDPTSVEAQFHKRGRLLDTQLRRRDLQTAGLQGLLGYRAFVAASGPSVSCARTCGARKPLKSRPRVLSIATKLYQISTNLGDAGERLDARARAEYQARLGELRAGIDEAERDNDLGRGEAARGGECAELSYHPGGGVPWPRAQTVVAFGARASGGHQEHPPRDRKDSPTQSGAGTPSRELNSDRLLLLVCSASGEPGDLAVLIDSAHRPIPVFLRQFHRAYASTV